MENRPKILLVEDNYDLRSFIESLLEHQYQVITAENGQEALDLINVQSTLCEKASWIKRECPLKNLSFLPAF